MESRTAVPGTLCGGSSVANRPKKRASVPRPYASGTMSNAEFWGFIKSALRSKSRFWKPGRDVKLEAKRKYTGPNKRQKFEYQCKACSGWFPDKEISVDHIVPVGSLKRGEDLQGVVSRMFCEKAGMQCLCPACHDSKTAADLLTIRQEKAPEIIPGL